MVVRNDGWGDWHGVRVQGVVGVVGGIVGEIGRQETVQFSVLFFHATVVEYVVDCNSALLVVRPRMELMVERYDEKALTHSSTLCKHSITWSNEYFSICGLLNVAQKDGTYLLTQTRPKTRVTRQIQVATTATSNKDTPAKFR